MFTADPQNLWCLMAVVDDTPGKRGSDGLTGTDATSQAFDTNRNTKTPLRLWLALVPIPALIVSMAAIYFVVKPTVFFEPAWLLPITNALFVTAVCFIVAYVAMKNYLATGRIQILLLGCGLLSFGLGGVIAGWVRSFPGGANLNVTIYNTAALLAAIFHFVAAFILLAGVSPETGAKRKNWWLVFSYAAIAAFTVLFTLATLWRIVPPFFVQGVGPTALRQVVLGTADVLFIFSFLIFMGWYLRLREAFLYWYASALALTAISLTGFFIQSAVGSPIGWISRFSQYLGGIYFLISVSTAIRTAHIRKTSIDFALAASLSSSEESFLRRTFDNMAERLIVCDSQGNILLANDAARKTYAIDEQIPWQVSRLTEEAELFTLDGRRLSLSERPLSRILRGEQIRSIELRLRVKASGQEFVLSYNGTPIRGQNGSVALAVLTSEDITERKRAEEVLRRAEEGRRAAEAVHAERQRFLDVLETLPVIVTLLRPDYRVEWVNRAYREALGDNVGRLCFESQFGRDKPCTECQAFTPLQTSQPHNWEWTLPDGRTFDIHNFPFADADGSPLILEMDIDITERRRAEEALRRANAYDRSLLEASLDPLVTIGPDGKITDVNVATEAATGNPRAALIGTDFSDYFTDPEKARTGYQQVFREGFVRDYPLELRHREGHLTPVLYNASLYRDESGQVVGVFAAARDITARKRAEAELARHRDHLEELVKERTRQLEDANAQLQADIIERKRAEQALLRSEKLASVGRMAATIAHEINNPLEAVMSLLFLAKEDKELPESVRQYLVTADAELNRIAHITRQSLGFYRESNAPALMSVNAVLESAVDLLKSRIKAKQAVIEKQWDGDVQVTAVAGELRQVFSNLLANSLDAIDAAGTIKLRVSAGAAFNNGHRCVRVTIADNGKGISAGSQQDIFEPFFTTKGTVGTGLGLWVSKQIIDKHGGTIRMRSSTSEARRGTVFSVVLPAEPTAKAISQSAGA
jgi:PAS domain S-box-containing protein